MKHRPVRHQTKLTEIPGFYLGCMGHLRFMYSQCNFALGNSFRNPADPFPAPIQEPPDPPENADVPVREPDPEDPGQI